MPGTRQRRICRVFGFAECGTRQSLSLSSARHLALGKVGNTRQSPVSRSVLAIGKLSFLLFRSVQAVYLTGTNPKFDLCIKFD